MAKRRRNLKKRLRACMKGKGARGRGKCLAAYMKAKKRR